MPKYNSLKVEESYQNNPKVEFPTNHSTIKISCYIVVRGYGNRTSVVANKTCSRKLLCVCVNIFSEKTGLDRGERWIISCLITTNGNYRKLMV